VAKSEAQVQAEIRTEAADKGMILWRNNSGMAFDRNGNAIRYGLANDSQQMNRKIKSADLIGIRPVIITPDMVGKVIGQFMAVEVKAPPWTYKGTEREIAQKKYIDLVESMGGWAKFADTVGEL